MPLFTLFTEALGKIASEHLLPPCSMPPAQEALPAVIYPSAPGVIYPSAGGSELPSVQEGPGGVVIGGKSFPAGGKK